MLRLAFSDLDGALIENILVTNNYDLANSAKVLSSFMIDIGSLAQSYEFIQNDDDLTSNWVVIPNDWEMVNSLGDRIPTYLKVLKQNN